MKIWTIGKSPFKVVYVQIPCPELVWVILPTLLQATKDVKKLVEQRQQVRTNLDVANAKHKEDADKRRRYEGFWDENLVMAHLDKNQFLGIRTSFTIRSMAYSVCLARSMQCLCSTVA